MQIFEFYFQSKFGEEKIIKSSFFEPKTIYEKKLGSLYFLGEKSSFNEEISLEEIFTFFKRKFYKKPTLSFQKAFEEAVKEINFYFKEKLSKTFSPDLNLLFLAIKEKKFALAKLGKVEIQLIRGGKLFNLSKRNKKEKFSFSLKIILGRFFSEDLISIQTQEIFEIFEKSKIFEHLKKMYPFNPKEFKEILESKKEDFKKSGVCTIFFFQKGKTDFSKESFSFKKEVKLEIQKKKEFFLRFLEKKEVKLILVFLFFLLLSFVLTKFLG
jgi:hypothetical protein